MKRSQIIFSKYSPLMAVDTDLVGSDQKNIETPRVCSLPYPQYCQNLSFLVPLSDPFNSQLYR